MLLLNPRRTRTNMKLLQLVWIFLLTLCGQSAITTITVKEDDDVILNCSFGATNIENGAFDWKKDVDQSNEDVFWYSDGQTDPGKDFRGRVSHFPDQLRFGNASIKITKAKTSDSGTYTCYHAIVKREVKSTVSLTVGAAPKPSVTVLAENKDWSLLQCEVRGAFPKPEVVWRNSNGNILDAHDPKVTEREGNKFDTVLDITVTKTDNYTCVATQKEINHQNYRTIAAHFSGGASKPSVTNLGDTKDGVLLHCEVFGASPELQVSWKTKAGQDVSTKEPQKTETGGGYDVILQTTVTQTDFYRCVTTEGKKDEVYSEIFVRGPEETSIGFMLPFLIGVGVTLVVGATGVFLWCRYKKQTRDSTTDGSIGKNESQAPLKQDV